MKRGGFYTGELIKLFEEKIECQTNDIYAFFQKFEPTIPKTTVNWKVYSLVEKGIIQRTGRGRFKLGKSNLFIPEISLKISKINQFIQKQFPYIVYCIWNIREINLFSQHLINKDICFVEVENDAVDAVYESLKEKFKQVRRNTDFTENISSITVRKLVSLTPIQKERDIPTITLEKLLVDLYSDKEFSFLQGNELTNVFNNAISKFTVNENRLLRYASRKERKNEIADFMKTLVR